MNYRPHEHIISWEAISRKTGAKSTVLHYPTEWRLYETSQRYPDANFKTEILYHNEETGFVVVQVKKTQATRQGTISEIDKIEGRAKAACARDFGLGTGHALASKPTLSPENRESLNLLYERTCSMNIIPLEENPSKQQFLHFIAEMFDLQGIPRQHGDTIMRRKGDKHRRALWSLGLMQLTFPWDQATGEDINKYNNRLSLVTDNRQQRLSAQQK